MTKIAALLLYGGKTLNIFFSRTRSPMVLKLSMQQLGLRLYKVDINEDPGLTLTYFMARSNLAPKAFESRNLLHSHLIV